MLPVAPQSKKDILAQVLTAALITLSTGVITLCLDLTKAKIEEKTAKKKPDSEKSEDERNGQ